jgi:hypothetical protein
MRLSARGLLGTRDSRLFGDRSDAVVRTRSRTTSGSVQLISNIRLIYESGEPLSTMAGVWSHVADRRQSCRSIHCWLDV